MEISQLTLARLWLYAFFMGTELGAVYDALCVIRVFLGVSFTPSAEIFLSKRRNALLRPIKRLSNRPLFLKLFIFLEDFFFLIYASVSVILLFYCFNNGKIRVPIFFCLLIGFLLYRWGPGRLLRPVLEIATVMIQNVCRYTVSLLMFPFQKVARFIQKTILFIHKQYVKNRERKQRIRFTKAEQRRFFHDACGML